MLGWAWLDGKKTTIGAALLFAAWIITELVVGVWGYNPEWMPKILLTVERIGGLVAGGGLAHKGVKMLAPAATPEEP